MLCPMCGVSPRHGRRGPYCKPCAARYARDRRRGIKRCPATETRFWEKVRESGGCWLWIGSRSTKWHGQFWFDGRLQKAHRYSWLTHRGAIPEGLSVLHKCDVPNCVNPDHLFLGTDADNKADMVAKGRQARGERMPHSKLTDGLVVEIRRRRAAGESAASIAADIGITRGTVYDVANRRAWKHVA